MRNISDSYKPLRSIVMNDAWRNGNDPYEWTPGQAYDFAFALIMDCVLSGDYTGSYEDMSAMATAIAADITQEYAANVRKHLA